VPYDFDNPPQPLFPGALWPLDGSRDARFKNAPLSLGPTQPTSVEQAPFGSADSAFGYDAPSTSSTEQGGRDGAFDDLESNNPLPKLAYSLAPRNPAAGLIEQFLIPQVCRPTPTNFFPLDKCLDTCAMGSPGLMELFCRTYTPEGTRNRARCWKGVNDLEAGDIPSCQNRCRAIAKNWGR